MNPTRLRHRGRRPTSPPGSSASSSSTARCAASSPSCSAPARCWSSSGRRRRAQSPATVHYRRMVWLLVFGLIHFYFIWFGDILVALRADRDDRLSLPRLEPATLIRWAIGLILVQLGLFTALAVGVPTRRSTRPPCRAPSAEAIQQLGVEQRGLRPLCTPASSPTCWRCFRGDYAGIVRHMLHDEFTGPLQSLAIVGWETLAYMLLGMAALKTGFLTGDWSNRALSQGGADRLRHRRYRPMPCWPG